MAAKQSFKDRDIQVIIGWVLRLGVIISVIVVFIGGIIYLGRHGHSTANYATFKGVPGFVYPHAIITNVLALRGQAIIQAGIILLIATPILRVFFSAIGFILEKDSLYTGITLLVLLIIIISMVNGYAG